MAGTNGEPVGETEEREVRPRGASLRKLDPKALMPIPSALRNLDADDIETLEKVLAEPMECVFNSSFSRIRSEDAILRPLLADEQPAPAVMGQDPDMPAASSTKSLSVDEEQELFLCLNYCRYRAMRVVRDMAGRRLTLAAARELLRWTRRALATRTHIIEANLSLVPAMAKRTKTMGVEIGDMICEGNLALLRSVDKFDCARGFKFSTYACRAILSSFSSLSAKSIRYRGMVPTEFDPALEKSDHAERLREEVELDCVDGLKAVLGENVAGLSEIEQRVLNARFNLGGQGDGTDSSRLKTLKQVAEMIGVTKERVRQIQNKALDKLRLAMEEEVLAA
ncbi:MAG: sigma-70 family RNA polymerase sigma factor [Phycisphaerae bacterium]|nr:sigma-70 family RNA polymerase sigma factor [Phycisphaerae bacterium]